MTTNDAEPGTAQGDQPTGQVPLAALHAERGRRQSAERERDDLLAQLKGTAAKTQGDPDPAAEAAAADETPPEAVAAAASPPDVTALNATLNASEAAARASHGDA